MMETSYIGSELEIFAQAINWKRYYGGRIEPFFGQTVLEVGAGLGETTIHLAATPRRKWLCLEPDPAFCRIIEEKIFRGELPEFCSVHNGTTGSLAEGDSRFDTILYIDVLEHLEDDRAELARAAALLDERGFIIVVAPAHAFLFSPFDSRIGHYRRYNRKMIRSACPAGLTLERLEYLDSVGMLLSLANRWLMRNPTPSLRQIVFWDRAVIPLSRLLDSVFYYRLGKSVLAVLGKQNNPAVESAGALPHQRCSGRVNSSG